MNIYIYYNEHKQVHVRANKCSETNTNVYIERNLLTVLYIWAQHCRVARCNSQNYLVLIFFALITLMAIITLENTR